MAFTTLRGRPRKPVLHTDPGTPELRLKHALRLTAEPIDLCLEKKLITVEQHWCGLHLRWLYTLRYGAPNLTTHYTDRTTPASPLTNDDPEWRAQREREYQDAIALLKAANRYECVMRLAVFNEQPAFLNHLLRQKAAEGYAMTQELARSHGRLVEGLALLAGHWRRSPAAS